MSMGFSRQDYWNGLPCPVPGDLPAPGIKPMTPVIFHHLLTANQGEKAIPFQDLPSGQFFFFFFFANDGGDIKRERDWNLLFFRLNVKFAQETWANILESLSLHINCFTGWLDREYHIYRNEMIPLWRVFHHRISWPGHLTPNLQR